MPGKLTEQEKDLASLEWDLDELWEDLRVEVNGGNDLARHLAAFANGKRRKLPPDIVRKIVRAGIMKVCAMNMRYVLLEESD